MNGRFRALNAAPSGDVDPLWDFSVGQWAASVSAGMRISHRHHFVFFSFPKTGSESVRRALNPLSDVIGRAEQKVREAPHSGLIPNHISPPDLRTIFAAQNWEFDKYFRFVFVRNPWSRLVSLYRMIQSEDERFNQPFDEWLLSTRSDGLGGAVESAYVPRWRRYGTYTLDNFICDETGTRLVDHVFRMEDMPIVPEQLRQRGIPLHRDFMPMINSRGPVDLNQFYTPASRAVVATRYAKDIDEFRYRYLA